MISLLAGTVLLTTIAQTPENGQLADYFGFRDMAVIPIGDEPGPMLITDLNADGLDDIVVANNHRSRIEILQQRAGASPNDPITPPRDINEFSDHWRYERILVPVSDAVAAIAAYDFDGDGLKDLLTGGPPGRITFLRQTSPGSFTAETRRDIRKLGASNAAFSVVDMTGNSKPDLVSIVGGEPTIWPIDGFKLGPFTRYPAGVAMLGVVPADYDGDGLMDLAGISPDDPAPVRIWFGRQGESGVEPGAQTIFEMPPIIEFEAIGSADSAASRIGVIERNARRIVLYELQNEDVESGGDREAAFTVHGFPDPGNRQRAWAVADVDGDGRTDVLAADTKSNAIAIYRQSERGDLLAVQTSPSLSDIDAIAVVPGSDTHASELLVLSSKEGVVGRTPLTPGELAFPTPLSISSGYDPVAMNIVTIDGAPHAGVVVNKKREYLLDLIDLSSDESHSIDLGSLSRKPNHVQSIDVDQDGREDIIVLTPERPMMLLLSDEEADDGFTVLEKKDMAQYGLVDAASANNITTLDVNGDGTDELLIAHGNFVRAVTFDRSGDAGGWRVIKQFNANDPDSDLIAATPLGGRLVAADKSNDRLLLFESTGENDHWEQSETLRIRGFTPGPLATGRFNGDVPGVITVGEDGFAIIPLGGQRRVLHEVGSWRSSLKGHIPHELAIGDINADGYGDMVALDAGEQMMELFTFDQAGDMLHATGFQIYESQLFHGGEGREYQPRQIAIADVTGDGKHDIVMLIHDRIVVYIE
ncbi:MAG: VCBS repeat-containing protein [Phycisphaerales bacterium]|nr:VCBS repeat-containing protein [Phycisphaerales bacterium]